eukprot:TRINITY_DN3226_c3_g1_i1.p1 TRINITY_DN3226_c3_g1~~TRINITY_DN3226_c3_g1_i1.p1  ORF type:complete len:404 (+),score=108.65 TRINITY_DN3226_c3_g1_i1:331-1542(+)
MNRFKYSGLNIKKRDEMCNFSNVGENNLFLRNLSYKNISIIHKKKPKKQIGSYIFEKTIGEGSYSKVREFSHCVTQKHVAIKTFSKKKMMKIPGAAEAVKREIALLGMVKHECIVKLLGVFQKADNSQCFCQNEASGSKCLFENPENFRDVVLASKKCVVLELLPNGSLDEYVTNRYPLSVQVIKGIFKSIVSAVGYLHSNGIAHRDIKPDNIVFDKNWVPKITDFNTAEYVDQHPKIRQWGSLPFQPPEVININNEDFSGIDSKSGDVWALGVLLYFLAIGRLPFSANEGIFPMLQNISDGYFVMPKDLDPSIAEMIQFILVTDPLKRPLIENLNEHSWCSEGKFSKCLQKIGKFFNSEDDHLIPDLTPCSPPLEPVDPYSEPPPPLVEDDKAVEKYTCDIM